VTVLNDALSVSFFERPTLKVTRELLGCVLNRRFESGLVKRALITEVEAYTQDDPACHAYRGMTKRNQLLFGNPGLSYVYFIYGMYHCLNVVTEPTGVAAAILIRGLSEPGLDGPGKICREWQIDRSHNGLNMTDPSQALWISPRAKNFVAKIGISKRIGIAQADAQERQWRFFLLPDADAPSRKGNKNGRKRA
jgi:DNA-3-methyladenine glycosylase